MTKEEAIKGLTSLVEVRRKYVGMQTMKDEIECLGMAIKALEQEPESEEKEMTYEITAEMNLKKFIDESREVTQALNEFAQALNEFADNLERIEKKYAEPQESEEKE